MTRRGLSEPGVARARRAIHDEPQAEWTAAGLAKVAGMSRSAFYGRFTAVVGDTAVIGSTEEPAVGVAVPVDHPAAERPVLTATPAVEPLIVTSDGADHPRPDRHGPDRSVQRDQRLGAKGA